MANNYNSDNTYDIVCPYCLRRFQTFRAMFADYKNFTQEVYPQYAEYLKHYMNIESIAGRRMPVLFQKHGNDGLDAFSALTESGDVTYDRACPECCNMLPAAAGRVKQFTVTVIGADDAQRSYYIASVLHRLNRDLQADFGASFIPADFKTAQTFREQYEEPLYLDKTVPEAMGTVTPLVWEYCKNGAAEPEEWKGSEVRYNRALIYIYNLDKDLCDRYPFIAQTAIAHSDAFVFISDVSEMAGNDDPAYEPWLGFLTETFRRLFGASAASVPTAAVLCRADKTAFRDRKWQQYVRECVSKKSEKNFPTPFFTKLSTKIKETVSAELPAYSSAIRTLFEPESTMFFAARTFFDLHDDGTADIFDCGEVETSFLWLLSKLNIINK
ncbi:MAG: hypothetical protein IK990_08665 [Ruminiclostridium sp.]|nr:hypothetical protein [Ruminiclostridium sp.]